MYIRLADPGGVLSGSATDVGVLTLRNGLAEALGQGDGVQALVLSPRSNPGTKSLSGALKSVVLERDDLGVGAESVEHSLGLRDGVTVPVLRVQVPGDGLVAQGAEGGEDLSVGLTVWWADPLGLDTKDLFEGGLELGDLGLDLSGGELGQVSVVPGVRSDLVARVVSLLDDVGVVVDAAVELAAHEESGLDTSRVERVDQSRSPLVRTVIEGDGNGVVLGAASDESTKRKLGSASGASGGGCGGTAGGRGRGLNRGRGRATA